MTIVIPRSVWKPRYSNGFAVIGTREWEAAGKEIWLHHSVTNPPGPDATLEEDCAHMRVFESIGQNSFGGGISYTWVVMPSGRVFQGHDIDRQGSHTYQRNNRSRAICLAGNFQISPLPERMMNSVAKLLRELGATIDGPHSAVYATACPGEHARVKIQHMNMMSISGLPIGVPTEEDEEAPMFQEIELKPTTKDANGKDIVTERIVNLPWQGGIGGVSAVSVNVSAANADMRISVAHWQINDGARRIEGMVPDGTVVKALTDTGGKSAPKGTWGLAIDYVAPMGGSLIIEAAR